MRIRFSCGCLEALGTAGVVTLVILAIVFNVVVGGLTTRYVLNYWGSYVREEPVRMPLTPCMFAGLFLAEISVPAAVGTFILSAFLDNPAYGQAGYAGQTP